MSTTKKQTKNATRSTNNKNMNPLSLTPFLSTSPSNKSPRNTGTIPSDDNEAVHASKNKNDTTLSCAAETYKEIHTPTHNLKRTPPSIQPTDFPPLLPPEIPSSFPATLGAIKRKRQSINRDKDASATQNVSSISNNSSRGKRKSYKKSNDESDSSTDFSLNDDNDLIEVDPHSEKPISKIIISLVEFANEINYVRRNSSNLQGKFNGRLKTVEQSLLCISQDLEAKYANSENNEKLIDENITLIKNNQTLTDKVKRLEAQIHEYKAAKNAPQSPIQIRSDNTSSPINKTFLDSLLQSINKNIDSKINDLKSEMISLINSNNNKSQPTLQHQQFATAVHNTPSTFNLDNHRTQNTFSPQNPSETWSKVAKRKNKKTVTAIPSEMNSNPIPSTAPMPPPSFSNIATTSMRRPKNVEVIYIAENKKSNIKLNQILTKAKENIKLNEFGIDAIKPRSSLNGGLILEIPKIKDKEIAPVLMKKIKSLFPPDEVTITCPKKYKEILLTSVDVSATHLEITEALRTVCGENEHFILGPVRPNLRGSATVWCKCEESAAYKLLSTRLLTIGWSQARLLPLDSRPVQCYKCWTYGHVRGSCTSNIDRIGWCFKCGYEGHPANTCNNDKPICRLCQDNKFDSNHKMGTNNCRTFLNYKKDKLKPTLNNNPNSNSEDRPEVPENNRKESI
ncbi:uncharacterized protein LOC108630444 [Ceratina calcarata]|uniref:Uncharacterized protein LOC108630444 n=1 Tax=Ceratina calcarata TaxID=156304 RepID=A0AAJ7ND21_9HYME|nr:uncharacterized protein LOC108630444 [Ceratina calcarata]